ncbi:GNAT family N-acetyltransferase [Microbacterium sp. DT81.1]|uniref:GNAT family N-acetyltransferase n=1 Tax=Microbacterium sp. DT81.1 TaxID=3393413 RepID=UPI003CEDE25E
MTVNYRLAPLADIDAVTLYRILWLRVRVFVVEQRAAYEELDGRDIEPGALLMWAESDGDVIGTLRILTDASASRIGRVATSESARGRGVGVELMHRAVAHCIQAHPELPIDLDAQLHLSAWYARFGFAASGDEYVEDDIPHVPMRRMPASTADGTA